jgi:hypothetical protein
MSVVFSADLAVDSKIELCFTPSNHVSRQYDIYEVYTGPHPKELTWWDNWGGYNDVPIINRMHLYIGEHNLVTVDSIDDCCDTPYSIYDEPRAGKIYVNVPRHTWLYDDDLCNYRMYISFTSGPKNTNNPSDDIYYDEHWPVRLETPKLTVKLSDVINGLTKYSTFDFTLFNDDGYFDDTEVSNFFNSPTFIRKTWVDNPTPDDFIPIRYGIVESIRLDDKTMYVSCGDIFRTLEEPVSKIVKDVYSTAKENRDKSLPLVYGTITTKAIKIDTIKIVIDEDKDEYVYKCIYVVGENIASVTQAFDRNGVPVPFSFDENRIITVKPEIDQKTGKIMYREIESAIVTGNTNNRLGDVIVDIITSRTGITYVASFWDLVETNNYRANSPRINIQFEGVTVRNAVKEALSSDTVFLVQKNDGKFTLRRWGSMYQKHAVPNWSITKFPSKDYTEAQNNYFSGCSIAYNYDFYKKSHNDVCLFIDNERQAKKTYNKVVRKTFETYLTNENDCKMIAEQLSNRFTMLHETIKISIGMDTSNVNLLDIVELEMTVNGRNFSKNKNWIVKEVDPAQDTLTLESINLTDYII